MNPFDIPIEKQSFENQLTYVEKNLKSLGMGLLGLSQDPYFRNILASEVRKEFHGETNALIAVLVEECKKSGLEIIPLLNEFLIKNEHQGDFETATSAFKNIDGITYLPQIYIPNFNSFHKGNSITRTKDSINSPVLIIYAGDESKEVYEGFVLGNSGKVESIGEIVDEEFATKSEVWIISLNESYKVGQDCPSSIYEALECAGKSIIGLGSITPPEGNPDFPPQACDDGHHAPGEIHTTYTRPTNKGITVHYNSLVIKDHKESWAAGASEINVIASTFWAKGRNIYSGNVDTGQKWYIGGANQYYAPQPYDPNGYEIASVSRNNVKDRKRIYITEVKTAFMEWGWNPSGTGLKIPIVGYDDVRADTWFFVIYEEDGFPAGRKFIEMRKELDPSTNAPFIAGDDNKVGVTYQSSDGAYISGAFGWYHLGSTPLSPPPLYPYPCNYYNTNSTIDVWVKTKKVNR